MEGITKAQQAYIDEVVARAGKPPKTLTVNLSHSQMERACPGRRLKLRKQKFILTNLA
jgi:hypothetical protein